MSLEAARPQALAAVVSPATFYSQLELAFTRAATAAGGTSTHALRFGPHKLELRFAGAALAERMLPPLEHLRTSSRSSSQPASPAADFCVSIFAEAKLPPAPWSRADYDARGLVAGFNDPRWHTLIDPSRGVLRLLDRQARRALCYFPSLDEALRVGYTTPLASLFAGFLRDRPLQLVHAGAVGTAAGGVLLCGKGGAGKSTTVAACLSAGLGVAGDDLVLVELSARPTVHSLLETIKLEPAALARLPALLAHATGTESLPCAKHVVWTRRFAEAALYANLPLRAVLVPAIVPRPTSRLLPISAAEALRSLAPSTLQLLPGGEAEAFAKMAALSRQLPCFRLEAGWELAQLPLLIRELVERLS